MAWVINAAQPSGGNCTRITLGGTSGTVVSTRILPCSAGRISSRMGRWWANGTASTTRSAAAAAAGLAWPLMRLPGRLAASSLAAACALPPSREPMRIWYPALAQRRARPPPSEPVPPMTAMLRTCKVGIFMPAL